jgi:hypothetical protein
MDRLPITTNFRIFRRRRRIIAETMGDINFEATEDPLKDLSSHRIHEDEEDEEGAGVDYRRLFKG